MATYRKFWHLVTSRPGGGGGNQLGGGGWWVSRVWGGRAQEKSAGWLKREAE